ncbi:hypothetical protein [uncultured Alsobacter sp.]|uniref:hypothetical protein n=1 Tax=uncultured Alsobacter sp. TaxID=1748258 RepID=UPI0025CF0971|nr:hypothetical protein [uncultured Alsobacter sp.]
MRPCVLAFALSVAAATPVLAQSSTTIIQRDQPSSGVVVEERSPTVVEKRTTTTETTGTVTREPTGCESTTVRKEGVLGDAKEVTKKSC